MKNKRLYLDIHVLQTVPPSCVNRDDTGSPKTAVYGGVTRARVSSQSWKRAMRLMFKETLPEASLGVRTLKIVDMVAAHIKDINGEENARELAIQALEKANLTIRTKKLKDGSTTKEGTGALFFMTQAQAQALAQLITSQEKPTKAQAQKALKDAPGVDVALFGRMAADDKNLNVDASAQVAHSLSTHKVTNEYDYFTAVDDLSREDSAGAGHINTVEFNSSTLYRYATLAVHELKANLAQGTGKAVQAFVDAFVRSMPTGRQNPFANRTLPTAVVLCLREDQPINLVGAFESPVKAGEGGYAAPSVKRLVEHAQQVYADFAEAPALTLVTGKGLDGLGVAIPFKALLVKLEAAVEDFLENEEVQA